MQTPYPPKTLIWAKLSGYPWWPAYIKSCNKEQIEVCFFGDFSRAFLSESKIRKFEKSDFLEQKEHKNLMRPLE